MNFTGTKPQFAEIFRYDITEAQIIQNRGFGSTLKRQRQNWGFAKKKEKEKKEEKKERNRIVASLEALCAEHK